MFEAKLNQGSIFKKALEALKDLVSEANWECNDKGIIMQSMDGSHVALCVLNLKEGIFDDYRCDRNITLGFKHSTLSKILKCAANDDIITLRAKEDADECTIILQSQKEDKLSEFEMKLMDIDSEQLGIPDTEYEATIKVPSVEFQRICRDLSQFGDTICITAKKNSVEFSGSGEIGSAKIVLNEKGNVDDDEKVSIDMEEEKPVKLSFASKFLNHFTRATTLSDIVMLQLCAENPLVVSYDISDMGSMKFYLAPKIEEDDD